MKNISDENVRLNIIMTKKEFEALLLVSHSARPVAEAVKKDSNLSPVMKDELVRILKDFNEILSEI